MHKTSSTNHNILNNYQEYFINQNIYNQKRDSFINLTKVYKNPFINLKEKYITLKIRDIKNIQKRIKIQINCKYRIKDAFNRNIKMKIINIANTKEK